MKIGVFDSGIGGEIVAIKLQKAFPTSHVITVNDHDNVPYGTKTPAKIQKLTFTAIQPLMRSNCDVIVIACNTATAVAIEALRAHYPAQKFIGLEPMIKAAPDLSKTGTVAICATPATLCSDRYMNAKRLYANHTRVIEPDCSSWASLIEANEINKVHITSVADECLSQGADVVVLGCTHYHWIKQELYEALGGKAVVLEPTDAIIKRIKQLLHLE